MPESPDGAAEAVSRPDDPTAPATVLAMAIVLYVGAIRAALEALVSGLHRDLGPFHIPAYGLAAYYLLYAGLGYALKRRKRWARVTIVIVAVIGLGIAAIAAAAGHLTDAIAQAAGPVTYLILINTTTAREWFRRPSSPPTDIRA